MATDKRLVPKLRFKEFKNTEQWRDYDLGDIGLTASGIAFPKAEQGRKEGIPIYKVSDMNIPGNENEMIKANNYLNSSQLSKHSWNPILKVPAVIFAKVGAAVMLNRKRLVKNPFLIDNNMMTYMFGKKWDYRFGRVMFENIDLTLLVQEGALPSYNPKDIERLKVNLPNLEEQVKIGVFFRSIDKSITTQQQKITKLKNLKAAYLNDMFPKEGEYVPKLRFAGFNKNWEYISLNSIGSTFSGLTGKTKKDFGHGLGEFITYMNVFNNSLSDLYQTEKVEIDEKQNEVKKGDILFTVSSETPEEVGMSSVWLGKRKNVYLNSFCFGLRPISNLTDSFFMAYLLRSSIVRKNIILLSQGISRYNISKIKVMNISVPVPSIVEQTKIGEFFRNLDKQIKVQEDKLDKLNKMKQAYLNEMFV